MRLKVLYHGNCFDGCASAAVFSRFFVERHPAATEVSYFALQHRQGDPFPPDAFDGDVNACLDFRYSSSPRLDWWFDHHVSGFQPATDRVLFERDTTGHKFWDPAAPSCTGFIARTASATFGWEAPDLADLVRWADLIDAARFPSASVAVRLEEPALRHMTLIEGTRDPALPPRLIEAMTSRPLPAIAAEPWVTAPLQPLLERHFRSVETVRKLAKMVDGVVEIDLTETELEGANKFVAYDLFPQARYAVVVSRDRKRSKVSVGFNPGAKVPRSHDIARLCERYGGGGHPVVGGVSLEPERTLDARRIAGEIASVLRGAAP